MASWNAESDTEVCEMVAAEVTISKKWHIINLKVFWVVYNIALIS